MQKKIKMLIRNKSILVMSVFIIFISLLTAYEKNQLNKCINSGHTRTYCEVGL